MKERKAWDEMVSVWEKFYLERAGCKASPGATSELMPEGDPGRSGASESLGGGLGKWREAERRLGRPCVGIWGHRSRGWITLGLEDPGKEFGFYFV